MDCFLIRLTLKAVYSVISIHLLFPSYFFSTSLFNVVTYNCFFYVLELWLWFFFQISTVSIPLLWCALTGMKPAIGTPFFSWRFFYISGLFWLFLCTLDHLNCTKWIGSADNWCNTVFRFHIYFLLLKLSLWKAVIFRQKWSSWVCKKISVGSAIREPMFAFSLHSSSKYRPITMHIGLNVIYL